MVNTVGNEKSTSMLLQDKLDARKKNRETIPLADLMGKYKNSYDKLNNTIIQLVYQLMDEYLFNFYVSADKKALAREMMKTLLVERLEECKKAMYQENSVDKFLVILAEIRTKVLNECFGSIDSNVYYSVNPFKPEKFVLQDIDGRKVLICSIDTE